MQHTLQFLAVSQQQYDFLTSKVGEPDKDGVIEGPTPFGEVKCKIDFNKQGGQLTVVILDKPFLLTIDTIKHQINGQLAEALKAPAPVATTTATTTESTPPPATPTPAAPQDALPETQGKTEDEKTTTDVVESSSGETLHSTQEDESANQETQSTPAP